MRLTGRVQSKRPEATWIGTGSTWKSPNYEADSKFFLNFSERMGPRQTIFFAESTDLLNWKRLPDDYEFQSTVLDEEGTSRLGWWRGNEKLKHAPIAVQRPTEGERARSSDAMPDRHGLESR